MSLIGERITRGSTSITVSSNIEVVFNFLSSIENVVRGFFSLFVASYGWEDGKFTAAFYIRHAPGILFIRFLRARAVSTRSIVKLKFSTSARRPTLVEHMGIGDLDRVLIRFELLEVTKDVTRIVMTVEISYKDEPEWVSSSLLRDMIDSFKSMAPRVLTALPRPAAPSPITAKVEKTTVKVEKPVEASPPPSSEGMVAVGREGSKLRFEGEEILRRIGKRLYDPLHLGLIALEGEVVDVRVSSHKNVEELLEELAGSLDTRPYLLIVVPQPSRRWELKVLLDGGMVVGLALERRGSRVFGRDVFKIAKVGNEALGVSITRISRSLMDRLRG